MTRQIGGAIIGALRDVGIAEHAHSVLDAFHRFLPASRITHCYSGSGLPSGYGRFTEGSIDELLNRGYDTVAFLSFPTDEDAMDGVGWEFRAEISVNSSRGADCIMLKVGFGESAILSNRSGVLGFCDHMAVSLKAESGHLHDLEDFADQNQRGLQYFRMAGKKVDSEKIRYSPVLKQSVVDVEQNPCHLHVYKTIDFCAAWTVYVGPEFVKMTGRCPGNESRFGFRARLLDEELWRVTLFDDPFSSRNEENVRILWDFRSAFRVDEVAHELVAVY